MPSDLAKLQRSDREHHFHPFTDFKALGERGTRVIVRGDGVYVWDHEGNKLLDAMSGLWNVNVGYGRRELVDAATRQLETLPYYNSFFQCTTEPAILLAERLAGLGGERFSHVFYAGSGSEANDTQIRLVRRYWQLAGAPDKRIIISRRNAYHGSTIGAASLGGMTPMHAQGELPIPGITHVEQPYHFGAGVRGPAEASAEAFGAAVARRLEEKILALGADRVAAFIGEPIQGAGGVIIPPENYWHEVQRICRRYDVLLIADEVITGFGRLGAWFAHQRMGFEPDLVTFAKGVTSGYVPLGGVLVGERVARVLAAGGGEFAHGYTYSGHPVACAVALANLDVLEREGLPQRVRDDIGPYFARGWQALAARHRIVGEARSFGLMGALELVRDGRERFDASLRMGERCRDAAIDYGLVMRAVGDTLVVAPPLIISHTEMDELLDKADRVLESVAAGVSGARPRAR
ncbi:MAG: aspartate aminotransferase family protein [Pseudomonadota bacterium]